MTDEIVLKPCPFCGGMPDVHETVAAFGICYAKPWVAECGNDGCHAIIEVLGDSEEDARRKWDIRSALLPADARERVAKALYEARHGELSGWTGRPEDNHLSFRLAGVALSALGLGR